MPVALGAARGILVIHRRGSSRTDHSILIGWLVRAAHAAKAFGMHSRRYTPIAVYSL
jgi:hypothetical protein